MKENFTCSPSRTGPRLFPFGLQLRHFALQPRDLGSFRLHLPVAGKGMLRVLGKRLHPVAQHRSVHAQVAGGLRHLHTALRDQFDSLKLELACKSPSFHGPPPVPSKHLTRCLRNRGQAKPLNTAGEFLIACLLFLVGERITAYSLKRSDYLVTVGLLVGFLPFASGIFLLFFACGLFP
jgi:hypothetical protein